MSEPMFGWSMGETMSVITFVAFVLTGAVAWLVGLVSERWGNRVAAFALILLAAGMLNSILLWHKPLVP